MSRKLVSSAAWLLLASFAIAGPKGTVPKASADRYPAHAERDGTKIGAALLSRDEVRKAFSFDVNRSCLVVEVALYPQKDKERKVSLKDFSLRFAGADATVKPSTATAVAAKLPLQIDSPSDVAVSPSAEAEVTASNHGVHVHTEAEVGVEAGSDAPHPVSGKDRAIAEAELADKGLPEGKSSSPVAGYIYFAIVPTKKDAALQLEYDLSGSKVVLQFSPK